MHRMCDVAAEHRGQIEAWCTHPALSELVDMFGGCIPPGLTLSARLAFLDEFSGVWDYRAKARQQSAARFHNQDAGGAVRWLIPRLDLPGDQLERIESLADQLGLIAELQPSGTEFDHVVVIGGGRYTNLLRTRYAGEMVASRRVGNVVLAAASRRLLDSEADAVAACAPGARTEFELMVAAARNVFGLDVDEVYAHVQRRVDRVQSNETVWRFPPDSNEFGVPVMLLETPSPDPERRRANSADTYTFAAQTAGMHGSSCLMVTGQPLVPYLHFEALRTLALRYDIRLQSAGFGVHEYNRLSAMDQQHPAKLLQEVRSTIRSARALEDQLRR
ncbi:hypothetical protein AU184_04730 [Mycolicibacterium novocastrense]|nr:hypothetical protein AU072_00915 [Mycolicibacterium novocastrense]KUH74268.1 hypothetical protein AU183_12910 [Mycolicibacterium novocastrense]KUH75273.1 hypothetical protein AU184_04730 [Mycolicibacterium novocastrense]